MGTGANGVGSSDGSGEISHFARRYLRCGGGSDGNGLFLTSFFCEDDDEEETKPLTPVHFDPIDSRHLSSIAVLKSRLTKLLKACPHSMHTSNNLMLKIVSPVCANGRLKTESRLS